RQKAKARRKQKAKEERGEAGPGKKKKKQFLTAEELSASGLEVPKALLEIVDLTGKERKVVGSGDIGTPKREALVTTEQEKIARMARRDIDAFGQEWKNLQERKERSDREEKRLNGVADEMADMARRLQGVVEATEGLQKLELHEFSYDDALEKVVSGLEQMQVEYKDEIVEYGLSEVGIAVLLPLFKEGISDWKPMENPFFLTEKLKRIRTLLQIQNKDDVESAFSRKGHISRPSKTTTYYES